MNYDEWENTYLPKQNHLAGRRGGRDFFETHGVELGYVLATADLAPNTVWTLVEGDEGTYVINGYHLVNRLAYFITQIPFEGEFLEVLDCLHSEVDE
jgi:hypothetical protein